MTTPAARDIAFRRGFHVPKGADPEVVLSEQEKLYRLFDKNPEGHDDQVPYAASKVLSKPDAYPQTALFIERDPEKALGELARQQIRQLWSSIVVVTRNDSMGKALARPVEVRVLHNVTDENERSVYRPLEVIRSNDMMKRELIARLQRDADSYAEKQRNVLAEIGETV